MFGIDGLMSTTHQPERQRRRYGAPHPRQGGRAWGRGHVRRAGAPARRAPRPGTTQNTKRHVEALHYRQSFSDDEFDPKTPEDVQRVNDLGYQFAKKMHPRSDCLVVTHTDGRGGKAHNHVLVINHDNETGKALSDYRTFHDRKAGNQKGVHANDELMREHGLSVEAAEHAPKMGARREDFEGARPRDGRLMSAALADPRADGQGRLSGDRYEPAARR